MNMNQLAKNLDVSAKAILEWVRKGCPHTKTKIGYDFELKAVRHWRAVSLLPHTPNNSYASARARKEAALASMRELDLKVQTGELVRRDRVDQEIFRVARQVRDAMLNIPSRISGPLAAERNQARVFEILTKEIHQALEALAHVISPDKKTRPS